MQLSSERQQWARFPWERRALARLQKPRGSVAFPGTPHVDTENYMTLSHGSWPLKVDGRHVSLPMIGCVEFWDSRPIEGTIKNVTVSRQGKHWFVALQVEMEVPDPVHPSTEEVGIDSGIATFAVNPRYTSQTCPECGHVAKENRLQQALFSCVACGYAYHADVVAAKNILALGHRERLNACSPR